MHQPSEILMLSGVTATCTDCGDERLFVPVDDPEAAGEFCCTGCDAAVYLLASVPSRRGRSARRAA